MKLYWNTFYFSSKKLLNWVACGIEVSMAGLHYHAIKNKNRNHLIN